LERNALEVLKKKNAGQKSLEGGLGNPKNTIPVILKFGWQFLRGGDF